MNVTKKQLLDTQEWFNHKFRGSTIYEGHPVQVIGQLIENALTSGWRPIEEIPIDEKVLIYTCQKEYGFAEKENSGAIGTNVTIHLGKSNKPTHWQPLPLPPVDGE